MQMMVAEIQLILVIYAFLHNLLDWKHGQAGEILAWLGVIAGIVCIIERIPVWIAEWRAESKSKPLVWSPEVQALQDKAAEARKKSMEMLDALKRSRADDNGQDIHKIQ
jgi:hypothetical protein